MAVGAPYLEPRFKLRDLDLRRATDSLAERHFRGERVGEHRFRQGSEGAGEIQSWFYIAPQGNGRHLVRGPQEKGSVGLVLPAASQAQAFAPGQRVLVAVGRAGATILGNPPGSDLALSERPQVTRSGELDALGIEAATPKTLESGSVGNVVAVEGFGFRQTPLDTFSPVIYSETLLDWIADPLFTVQAVVWVSVTRVDLTIDVAAAAPPGHTLSLEVERS